MESNGDPLPIFNIERVQLQFSIASNFVAAQVADNVLILALSTGRLLRIDLDNPADIDDVDLPKKSSEVGVIKRMFLDPTSSHLIITTTLAENFYLHTQSRQPRPLPRLKGVAIESIGWNPSLPTASTREILVGAVDGNVYEVYIEPSTEFYRREEKYLKGVFKVPDGPVSGLWVGLVPGKPDFRNVVVASPDRLLHFSGRIGRHGHEGAGSIFSKLFESESPTKHEVSASTASAISALVVSPDPPEHSTSDTTNQERYLAWLSAQGVLHGSLQPSATGPDTGAQVLSDAKLISRAALTSAPSSTSRPKASQPTQEPIRAVALTQWHVLILLEGKVIAVSRLDNQVCYEQVVLEPGRTAIGLLADQKKSTYWLITSQEIFEIVAIDEDRDVWKVMLSKKDFHAAFNYAKTPAQKDNVATASGDYLFQTGQYLEAATVYGKSSKSFEQVALALIDQNEQDALRKYLLTKLSSFKKSLVMQRTMVASWLVEIFMTKIDTLEDALTSDLGSSNLTEKSRHDLEISRVQAEFREFVSKHKSDLDQRTTYDIISSHGREEELIFYATVIQDFNFVLAYWVQREQWSESLAVLKKQTDPQTFYNYSSVLLNHVPNELVDILMRQSNLDPKNLIPALLNYNESSAVPLSQNQAVRYILFVINQLHSTDPGIHNTLISIYASHPSPDESALLNYLESQSHQDEQSYDADFALRLCILHNRVRSCVHIYSSMGQYLQAVELALKHDEVDMATTIADRPESDSALRKRLWLAVAKKVISQSDGISTAIKFLKRCELLRIEDLIPFFPDFVVIDDFKEEICSALEDYSRHIDMLKKEMDEASETAAHIKTDIAAADHRYAIVEPGERCYLCRYPLLSRQFFVFPCQHAFHSDCLSKIVIQHAGVGKARRIKELQMEVSRAVTTGDKREQAVKELDSLVAASCVLCSEFAVKQIDEPFVSPSDNKEEWAL